MADVRVTVYTTDLGDRWEGRAIGGDLRTGDSYDVRIERPTEAEVEADFPAAWNERAGTSWAPDEFVYEQTFAPEE